MKDYKKLFKVIFWVGTFFVLGLVIATFSWLFLSGTYDTMPKDDQLVLRIMPGILFVIMLIVGVIGYLVYRDAKKLGMNEWMWLLIAIYAPNGIGIIIYLIIRFSENKKKKCSQCGYPIKDDYLTCPKCGYTLKDSCAKCGTAIEPDWKICPHCKKALK